MEKRKCPHCGYSFKPREETEITCEACKIQLRVDSSEKIYDVKHLRPGLLDIQGELRLRPEKVVFEPKEVYFKDKKIGLPLLKIRDVRYDTEKEWSTKTAFFFGITNALLFPETWGLLTIDY